ncbi:MAG TPA: RNA degradosome polyphosphate kinase, partial [Opitutus sp.]|nr:RNA degradosome polyphosphate kinase [Opitutus sp.]
IEALFPIYDPEFKKRLIDELLASELRDNEDARELQSDGSYKLPARTASEPPFSAQRYFIAASLLRGSPPAAAAG